MAEGMIVRRVDFLIIIQMNKYRKGLFRIFSNFVCRVYSSEEVCIFESLKCTVKLLIRGFAQNTVYYFYKEHIISDLGLHGRVRFYPILHNSSNHCFFVRLFINKLK